MRFMKRLITALVLLLPVAGISHQPPPEVLFMSKLGKLELIPRGESGCPKPNGREGQVVFSNSCGCGSARFSVEAAGVPKRLRKHTVDYSIDEWCEPGIHLFSGARWKGASLVMPRSSSTFSPPYSSMRARKRYGVSISVV